MHVSYTGNRKEIGRYASSPTIISTIHIILVFYHHRAHLHGNRGSGVYDVVLIFRTARIEIWDRDVMYFQVRGLVRRWTFWVAGAWMNGCMTSRYSRSNSTAGVHSRTLHIYNMRSEADVGRMEVLDRVNLALSGIR